MSILDQWDPEVAAIVHREEERHRQGIELIASENYASAGVLAALATVLNTKYAEGYPGKRYYGGCENVDKVEELAISRARKLFGADHVNVQPHSGAEANRAVYAALMEPGDVAMGMDLAQGGHLTHGFNVNFSGKLYRFVHYGVDRETELLDCGQIAHLAREHRPKVIVVGATAYPRIIDFACLREIADEVGAYLVADIAHIAGLVAAGIHPSPVGYAHVISTTTHKTLRGPRGAMIMCQDDLAQTIDRAVFPGTQGGPHMHSIAAKAVCFGEALKPEFADYQRRIVENARTLADELHQRGMRLVSGGTDNHLMLVDVGVRGVTGRDAQMALDAVGITVNKNTIPYDQRPPAVASGLRIGTPAATSRGMGPGEMRQIADFICRVLDNPGNEGVALAVRQEVRELTGRFPVPGVGG
jgi:glycine hydroxymethyltransferase